MAIREVAAAAYEEVLAREETARMSEADRMRAQREREEQDRERSRKWAQHVLTHPANPLQSWFPDEEFRVWDHAYGRFVIAIPVSDEYSDIPPKDWLYFIIWAVEEPFDTSTGTHTVIQGVRLTRKVNDPQYGAQWENSWFTRGMGLTGPADVGRYLREREDRRERAAGTG